MELSLAISCLSHGKADACSLLFMISARNTVCLLLQAFPDASDISHSASLVLDVFSSCSLEAPSSEGLVGVRLI